MEKIGDYEYSKKDLIGHGAFAIVFKGRHQKNPDHVVAIKCVPKGKLGKSQPLIGKEIKILQELTKLQHRNVVALLECVDSPKNLYIVIEYCNGGDLSDYLNAKGSLSEDTIRLFLRQIAEAMKVLNQKEVVHRDLKPQNILLCHQEGRTSPSPKDITLKIADFGFARFLADGVMAATLCGSPMYMAPEVIMSLKYDAKADLWSVGTIVYQCLTGKAPFMAPNPQQLKHFYEKNANLAPSIPNGTSEELRDLLIRLMKRDAKDRMDFDELFNHPFLKAVPRSSSPVPVPLRRPLSPPAPQSWGGEEMASSTPSPIEQDFVVVPPNFPEENKFAEVNKNSPLKHQLNNSNGSPQVACPSHHEASSANANIDVVGRAVTYRQASSQEAMQISEGSPARRSPCEGALPVPTQRGAYERIERSLQGTPASSPLEEFRMATKRLSPASSPKDVPAACLDWSRRSSTHSGDAHHDIHSFTPPTVQFSLGTPPGGGRLRSLSCTPPPCSGGRQTPTGWRHTPPHTFTSGSPLRRSGSTPPPPRRALELRNPLRATLTNGRALTLPDFNARDLWPSGVIPESDDPLQRSGSSGRMSDNSFLLGHHNFNAGAGSQSPPYGGRPLHCGHHCCCSVGHPSPPLGHFFSRGSSPEGAFLPPELPEETLLEKEHNDTLAKLNFVSALVKCILELAKTRSSPLSCALSSSITQTEGSPSIGGGGEGWRRAVQLLLYMKGLQLISSAFHLSQTQVRSGHLQPSASVRNVLCVLKEQYHVCLSQCKSLNSPGLLQSVGLDPQASDITADKILYNYAIQMCQSAALEELFGEPKESFHRYQTAQILLHSLGQQVNDRRDKELLHKYRDAVQRRLEILTNNRSVYAYHTT